MKFFKILCAIAIITVAFFSCQKELNFPDTGVAYGVFKKDAGGDCLPVTVTGIFQKDTATTTAQFVDVQINANTPGNFDIRSDTVNGFWFYKVGTVPFGVNTIRLYAYGKPIAAGTNTFTITFGASQCSFDITTVGAGAPGAVFTLSGSPTACTGVTIGGTYTAGVALAPANTFTVEVNVTAVGTYTIIAASTPNNNFGFAGTGVFTTTGLQNVTLTGTGTPTTAGTTSFAVVNNSNSCTYPITVLPNTPAVFTYDGGTGACTAAVVSGTYIINTPTTASNTVTLNVTVTTPGAYNITTNTINGMSFSKTGVFTATGSTQVVLNAVGTPTQQGNSAFTPTGTGSCTFSLVVQPPPPPAAYTLGGAGGACTPITVNGAYQINTALGAANTAVVQVNVTTVGLYTLSTNTVNGMTFSKSGTFTTLGAQTVTLQGSGTPTAATTSTLTPQYGSSSCTFNVVVAAASTAIYQCKIDGVLNTFSDQATSSYFVPGYLSIDGNKLVGSFPDKFGMGIDKSSTGNPVTVGTYTNTLAGTIAGGYILGISYTDASNVSWGPASVIGGSPDPFTIIITQFTATRLKGTFTGTIRNNFGSGTSTHTITEGVFDVPFN